MSRGSHPACARCFFSGGFIPSKARKPVACLAAARRPFPDWQLRLVGPAEAAYRADLERLAADLDLKRVTFAGPRYGTDKHAEYAAADLYVLPSYTENFGMSVRKRWPPPSR